MPGHGGRRPPRAQLPNAVPARHGNRNRTMLTEHRFDVLIVGMGPAGIAAACAAAESGRRVGVVDDNPREGGQIWRGEANRWIARFQASRLEILRETRVVDSPMEGV